MEVNLQVLDHQVAEAASQVFFCSSFSYQHFGNLSSLSCWIIFQGADILLLPEDAIHGSGYDRLTLVPFLELVPAEADGSQPCFDDGDHDNYLLRQSLAHNLTQAQYQETQLPCPR